MYSFSRKENANDAIYKFFLVSFKSMNEFSDIGLTNLTINNSIE